MASNELYLQITQAIHSMMRDMEGFCREEGDRLEARIKADHAKDVSVSKEKNEARDARLDKLEKHQTHMDRLIYVALGASLIIFGKEVVGVIGLLL